MKAIPRELEEAAILDGATGLILIFRIFLPVMGPGTIATGLLAFVAAWNEFLFAVTFTVSEKSRTVPVAIAFMSGSSEHELPWGNIMAASVVVTLPLILLVVFFQRYMISGLTAGAVKG
jgi:trehalose/maltose transport system permease protein